MPPHFPVPFTSLAPHKCPLEHRLVPCARHQVRLGRVPRRSERLLAGRERQLLVERIEKRMQTLRATLRSALSGAHDTHLIDL